MASTVKEFGGRSILSGYDTRPRPETSLTSITRLQSSLWRVQHFVPTPDFEHQNGAAFGPSFLSPSAGPVQFQ